MLEFPGLKKPSSNTPPSETMVVPSRMDWNRPIVPTAKETVWKRKIKRIKLKEMAIFHHTTWSENTPNNLWFLVLLASTLLNIKLATSVKHLILALRNCMPWTIRLLTFPKRDVSKLWVPLVFVYTFKFEWLNPGY